MALTKVKGSVADPIYLNEDENLADLPDKAVARQNLDVPVNAPKNGKVYVMQDGQWIEMVQSIQLPVGAIISWPGKSAPAGWLAIEPVTVYQRTDYPALYKHFQDECPHLIIDADTFKLAEGRGAFFRGYDPTGINDPDGAGRELLTPQTDAIRNITGSIALNARSQVSQPTGAFKNSVPQKTVVGSTTFNGTYMYFDASLVVPTAAENRPKNLNALWIIKAYDNIEDPELIKAQAIINQVNSNSSRIQLIEDAKKPVDYQLMDFGTVKANSRYVKDNPFGNIPVRAIAEIQIDNHWSASGGLFGTSSGAGVKAHMYDISKIVVQTGTNTSSGIHYYRSGDMLGGFGLPSRSIASAPCRVHVWRTGV